MSDVSMSPPGRPTATNPYNAAVQLPRGTPVCYGGAADVVTKARANALATSLVLGLAANAAAVGSRVFCKYAEILELTADEWDALIVEGGALAAGQAYYLDAAAAGFITATPPSAGGDLVVLVGIAVSADELQVTLGTPTSPPDILE